MSAPKDCVSCRVVTAATFLGLGAHSIVNAPRIYARPGSVIAKVFFNALGVAFIGMGLYRAYPLFTGKWGEDRSRVVEGET